MTDNEIFDQLNNPEFKINLTSLLLSIRANTLMNKYHLQEVLKLQLEIKELLQGNTGQEAENNVESKLSELDSNFQEYLKDDLTDDLTDFSLD